MYERVTPNRKELNVGGRSSRRSDTGSIRFKIGISGIELSGHMFALMTERTAPLPVPPITSVSIE